MTFTPVKPMEVALDRVKIQDKFWLQYQRLVRDVVIPYQWEALNDTLSDTEPSHAIENFRIAAGQIDGTFYGMVFQDSDVAKWLEAVAYLLHRSRDSSGGDDSGRALEKTADEVIELVAAAQQEDGYLNTYFTVKAPDKRWTNLAECHELYCAGHLIEAGVAYFHATGKSRLLEVVCRLADHINRVFGPLPEQIAGYPGHPEIELALMKLYEATGNPDYMALSRYFIEQRGVEPHFYDIEYEKRGRTSHWDVHGPAWMIKGKGYSQAHLPIARQDTATGHAVRFVYLYAGVAHLARLSGAEEKLAVCRLLWENMTQRQMYITGAIGSQSWGESFSCDYDLPNDTAYTETCASVGLIMFANRMLQLQQDSRYADVMERALYNTVLAGMALDGKHFFYVNPLEVHPKSIRFNHIYDHVKPVRQRWFGCACCPPNIARLLSSLGQYIYTVKEDTVWVNLYIGSETRLDLAGKSLTLIQNGDFPWDEHLTLTISCPQAVSATLALRLPDWCSQPEIAVNDQPCDIASVSRHGYARIGRTWQEGDRITLRLPMAVLRVKGNGLLRHVAGKVALQRGPLVYCLEQADNGPDLHNLRLDADANFRLIKGCGVLAGKTLIQGGGTRIDAEDAPRQPLYQYNPPPAPARPITLIFIPYFSWANRGEGEMRVWINEHP